MASVVKCMSIMTGAGLLGGALSSYYLQSKVNKAIVNQAQTHSKDGTIPIGGMTKDGKLWDGKVSVDEFKKQLDTKAKKASLASGLFTAAGTALVTGLTLLLRGKIKA
uniref:Uncharacterized protein n=1 Tax=uncultured Candidatus Melainabacteria bacterium TaxID=2682970 RepID=A0A650ELF1_9BACT|nr:hypothetical protein Melaina855_1710 [uncultured Candidatus Melainabacteria bacterium]